MKECPKCKNLAQDSASSCPQCGLVLDQSVVARAARPRVTTVTEATGSFSGISQLPQDYRPAPPPPSPESAPARPAVPSGRRGQTIYAPFNAPGSTSAAAAAAPAPSARRVLAVLVTYSWKPEGQVFPIREGRNLIGRGDECDVRVPEDPALSSTNSHITFRQSFTIGDLVSMSGTDLDGVPIEEQFRPLKNLAKVRAGSTNFLFVVVDPALLGI